MASRQLTLEDGRQLEYKVAGSPTGFPLVFLHGTPGSVAQFTTFAAACKAKNVKLITLSRAGYGNSSRKKGRSVVDCVDDIEALLKHLGHKESVVAGWSGGGPHALACAARLSGCKAALSIAGVGPHNAADLNWLEGQGLDNVKEFEASMKGEEHLTEFLTAQRGNLLQATADAIVAFMSSVFPEADKRALANNKEIANHMVESFAEGLKYSCDGWIDDDLAMVKPTWGFSLDEIRVPVYVWQGELDLMVPFGHGKWLASHLPQDRVTAHLLEGEGHISIFLSYADQMLNELLQNV